MAKFNEHRKQEKGKKDSVVPRSSSAFQITVPQCKVCQSPNRAHIDRMLTMGLSAMQVAEQYSLIDGIKYTRKSFANHKKKHLTLHDAAIRHIVEKRAEEAGIAVEEATENLLTARGVLETMVNKGFQALVNDQVKMRPEDTLAALKHLKEEDEEFYRGSVAFLEDQLREEINALIEAVRKVVPPSMQDEITGEFKKNMTDLKQKREQISDGK